MKYEIVIKDIKLNEKNTEKIDLSLVKNNDNTFANSKSRVVLSILANVFDIELIKKLISLKDEYIDVVLNYEGIKYSFNKMYIYRFNQNFSDGVSKYELILYQKFIGRENELILIENKD